VTAFAHDELSLWTGKGKMTLLCKTGTKPPVNNNVNSDVVTLVASTQNREHHPIVCGCLLAAILAFSATAFSRSPRTTATSGILTMTPGPAGHGLRAEEVVSEAAPENFLELNSSYTNSEFTWHYPDMRSTIHVQDSKREMQRAAQLFFEDDVNESIESAQVSFSKSEFAWRNHQTNSHVQDLLENGHQIVLMPSTERVAIVGGLSLPGVMLVRPDTIVASSKDGVNSE